MKSPAGEDPQTYAIIGAAFEVHGEFGDGFSESIHREAFTLELLRRGIPFVREVRLRVYYKGDLLARHQPRVPTGRVDLCSADD